MHIFRMQMINEMSACISINHYLNFALKFLKEFFGRRCGCLQSDSQTRKQDVYELFVPSWKIIRIFWMFKIFVICMKVLLKKRKNKQKKREKMILHRALFLEIRPCYSEHSSFRKKNKKASILFHAENTFVSRDCVYVCIRERGPALPLRWSINLI